MILVGGVSYRFGYYLFEGISCKKFIKFTFNKKLFLLFLVFSIFLGFILKSAYTENNTRPIWLDEYTQFKKVTDESLLKQNIINVAASEQQPPLDYFFSSAAFSFLGWTPIAARIHAVIFYLILFILIFFYTWEKYQSLVTQSLVLMIFASTPLFRYYAIEGRPTMLACLTIFLYFIEVESFSQKQEQAFCPFLFLSTFISAMAIGIQTQLIVSLYSIIIFLHLLKKDPKSSRIFFLTHAGVFAISLPILILIYNHSQHAHQFVSFGSVWSTALNKFNLNDLFNIISYRITTYDFEYLFWFFLFMLSFRKIFSGNSDLRPMGFLYILFPFIIYFIFIFFINWSFTRRYYINFLIFILPLWMNVIHWLSQKLKARHLRSALVFISLFVTFRSSDSMKSMLAYVESHSYSKDLYESLANPSFTNYAISFNLPKLGQWQGSQWISKEFYAKNETYLHNSEDSDYAHHLHIDWNKLPKDKLIKIHLIINTTKSLYRHSIIPFINELLPEHSLNHFNTQTVVSFNWHPSEASKKWDNFLTQLQKRLPQEYHYIFLKKKLAQAFLENNYDECLILNREFRELRVPAVSDGGLPINAAVELEKNASSFNCGLLGIFSKDLYDNFIDPSFTNYAINFNLPILGQWRGGEWRSHEIYASKETFLHDPTKDHLVHHLYINWKKLPKDKPFKIYLILNNSVSLYRHSILPFIKELLPAHNLKKIGRQTLVTFTWPSHEAPANWEKLLSGLKEKLHEDYHYLFHEKKLAEAILENKYDECHKLNQELLKLKVPKISEGGVSIDVSTELEKNAKIFHCGLVSTPRSQ